MKLKMNGGKNKGYTIVEVMIVLAITGVMFILAMVFISGKQDQVAFRQSVADLNSDINQAINDVTNGFYPAGTGAQFTCSDGGSSGPNIAWSSSPTQQGTNNGCVFLGKVLQFYTKEDGNTSYRLISVAGNSEYNGNPVQSLANAYPTPIIGSNGGGNYDTTAYKWLNDGNTFPNENPSTSFYPIKEYASSTGPATSHEYAVAIFTNLTNTNLGNAATPGVRAVSLYTAGGAPHIDTNTPFPAVQTSITKIDDTDLIDRATICVTNGSKQAYITIGGSGKLTTDITWGACP